MKIRYSYFCHFLLIITHEVSLYVREENFKILLGTLVKVVKGTKIETERRTSNDMILVLVDNNWNKKKELM